MNELLIACPECGCAMTVTSDSKKATWLKCPNGHIWIAKKRKQNNE